MGKVQSKSACTLGGGSTDVVQYPQYLHLAVLLAQKEANFMNNGKKIVEIYVLR